MFGPQQCLFLLIILYPVDNVFLVA